jgi:formiminotetrahydrofolate cyclodeaminase
MEIKNFLDKLALSTPTPGGGSASALAGALSASLVSMVAGLSSKKGDPKRKKMEEIRKKALAVQKRLVRAIDEDAKYFDKVMKAFQFPKNTEKERMIRSRMIQKAYKDATIIPRLICHHSIQLLEYSKTLILEGYPNAIGDAGVAAFLADAALAGGLLNIGFNLIPGTEKKFLREMNSFIKRFARERKNLTGKIRKLLRCF